MKALLVCDEYIYCYNNSFFVKEFSMILINRYLNVFEQLRIAARCQYLDSIDTSKYYRIENPSVEVYPLVFFRGALQYFKKYSEIKRKLISVCTGCNVAILRLPSTVAFAAWKHVLENKLPYIVEVVFDPFDGFLSENNLFHKVLWYILYRRQKKACALANGVSCVTRDYLQRRYYPIGINKFVSHYSSVELSTDFYFHPRHYPVKKQFKIIHVANQVSYKGRKGHVELIRAVKILRNNGLDVCVNFVGADYNGGIQRLKEFSIELGVKEYVHFLGFLSQNELRDILLNSDVAALPTKAEGLPRVVIEAIATALPCVTTRVSGNPELIQDEFLIDYDDVDSLVQKLESLITNPVLYEAASLHNFENSREYESYKLTERRNLFYENLKAIAKNGMERF